MAGETATNQAEWENLEPLQAGQLDDAVAFRPPGATQYSDMIEVRGLVWAALHRTGLIENVEGYVPQETAYPDDMEAKKVLSWIAAATDATGSIIGLKSDNFHELFSEAAMFKRRLDKLGYEEIALSIEGIVKAFLKEKDDEKFDQHVGKLNEAIPNLPEIIIRLRPNDHTTARNPEKAARLHGLFADESAIDETLGVTHNIGLVLEDSEGQLGHVPAGYAIQGPYMRVLGAQEGPPPAGVYAENPEGPSGFPPLEAIETPVVETSVV
ncbi:MAG TPA: hypothetical protein VHB72_00980 [Candidatus Saccharimonadales bacterium]|nr:hypothetical protein [Candidatus Saccharimonadales bacterium]